MHDHQYFNKILMLLKIELLLRKATKRSTGFCEKIHVLGFSEVNIAKKPILTDIDEYSRERIVKSYGSKNLDKSLKYFICCFISDINQVVEIKIHFNNFVIRKHVY